METRAHIFIASLVFLAVLSSSAQAHKPTLPPAQCYTKEIKCCFVYKACGHKLHRVVKKYPCPYKKCVKKCVLKCEKKPVTKTHKVCVWKWIIVTPCKKHGHGWDWKKTPCKPVKKYVKKCRPVTKTVYIRRCYRHCYRHCFTVKATCGKITIFKTFKFCPRLHCEKEVIRGNSSNPGIKYSKKILVKTIPQPRVTHH